MKLSKKKCVMCGEIKPLRSFSKRKNVNKTKVVYYKSHCKECCVELSTGWRKNNIERSRKYIREYQAKKRLFSKKQAKKYARLVEGSRKSILLEQKKTFKKAFTYEKPANRQQATKHRKKAI